MALALSSASVSFRLRPPYHHQYFGSNLTGMDRVLSAVKNGGINRVGSAPAPTGGAAIREIPA